MNYDGFFKDWQFNPYGDDLISNGKHSLAVAHRWTFWDIGSRPLLSGLTFFERNRLWKEWKKERRRRALESLASFVPADRAKWVREEDAKQDGCITDLENTP